MKRNLIPLNLALLATACLLSWFLVGQWRQFEVEHRLDKPNPGSGSATGDSDRPASLASATSFAPIVDHHLFSLDRNNDLTQEVSDQPQEEVRPVPVLKGTLGIGGEDYALMVSGISGRSGSLYRRLKVGQALDGYVLVRVEADRVVMRSGDRDVRIGINERSSKGSARRRTPSRTDSARPRGTESTSGSRRQRSSNRQTAPSKRRSDTVNVPAGTVRDGKRLIIVPTPFGDIRRWVEDKPK